jgi:hypothetical protein
VSTSRKTPASIRQGGPGASHENAKTPLRVKKPPADSDRRQKSAVSGGGGERDSHHSHEPERKGGGTRPARTRPTEEALGEIGRLRRTKAPKRNIRQSEFPVSRRGMHQESRDHNKHNDPGQSGHKPQEPSPAQEKH